MNSPDLPSNSTRPAARGPRILLGLLVLAAVLVTFYQYDQSQVGRSAQYQYGSRKSAVTLILRFADTRSALLGRPGPRRIVVIAREKRPDAMADAAFDNLIPARAEGLVLISADEPPKVQVCRPALFEKLWEIWSNEAYQELVQEPVAAERRAIEGGAAGQPFARFVLNKYKDRLDAVSRAFFERHDR